MANDLEIQARFLADSAELKKLNEQIKNSGGLIAGMSKHLQVLQAQKKAAFDPKEIARLNQEIARTKTNLDSLNGVMNKTKGATSGLDAAFSRAGKKLFDLGNILKASIGFLGVAGLVGKFVEATGAADLLEKGIEGVVKGLKNLDKTQAEIEFSKTTLPLLEKARKFTESQKPADQRIIAELEAEKARINRTIFAGAPQTVWEKELKMPVKPMADSDRIKLEGDIALIQEAIDSIKALENADKYKKTGATTGAGLSWRELYTKMSAEVVKERNEQQLRGLELQEDVIDDTTVKLQAQWDLEKEKDKMALEVMWERDKALERGLDIQDKINDENDQFIENSQRYNIQFAQNFTDVIGMGAARGFKGIEQMWKQMLQRMLAEAISMGLLSFLFPSAAAGGAFGFFGNLFSGKFDEGGYTGSGGKYEPAGVVHKGEVVWSQADIQKFGGLHAVESIRPTAGTVKSYKGQYFGGGEVVSGGMGSQKINVNNVLKIKLDGFDVAYSLEAPNGGYEKLNRARGN